MVAGLRLDVSAKALGHPDARTALRAVLRAWLPLSDAVLGMAVAHLPDPAVGCCSLHVPLALPVPLTSGKDIHCAGFKQLLHPAAFTGLSFCRRGPRRCAGRLASFLSNSLNCWLLHAVSRAGAHTAAAAAADVPLALRISVSRCSLAISCSRPRRSACRGCCCRGRRRCAARLCRSFLVSLLLYGSFMQLAAPKRVSRLLPPGSEVLRGAPLPPDVRRRSLPLFLLNLLNLFVVQSAAPERVPRLLPPRSEALRGAPLPPDVQARLHAMEAAVGTCDTSPGAPLVVYVSKMVAVPASALPR